METWHQMNSFTRCVHDVWITLLVAVFPLLEFAECHWDQLSFPNNAITVIGPSHYGNNQLHASNTSRLLPGPWSDSCSFNQCAESARSLLKCKKNMNQERVNHPYNRPRHAFYMYSAALHVCRCSEWMKATKKKPYRLRRVLFPLSRVSISPWSLWTASRQASR